MKPADDAALEGSGALAMMETGGNQAYIFGSNRLRENLGASELVYQACTVWVEQAGADIANAFLVSATSGRAIVFFKDEGEQEGSGTQDQARKFVFEVTCRALRDAPGLAVGGAVLPWKPGDQLSEKIRELSTECELAATANPPIVRFLGLPILARCDSTGLPAEQLVLTAGGKPRALSAVALAKRTAADRAQERLRKNFELDGLSIDELERRVRGDDRGDSTPRLAVIHADGNRIGQAFIALANRENSLQKFRFLSKGLEEATTEAVRAATAAVQAVIAPTQDGEGDHGDSGNRRPLLVPLVVAGDDLTFLSDARLALVLTETLLGTFEERTEEVATEMKQKFEKDLPDGFPTRFSMGAGIAMIKPHYPFHAAYALAEDLAANAKSAARAEAGSDLAQMASTFDVHLVSDSAAATLDSIQNRRTSSDGSVSLRGGPYVVGRAVDGTGEGAFVHLRPIGDLTAAMALLMQEEDGRRTLSASSVNRARWALFNGDEPRDIPDALLRRRPRGNQESVVLLDALELAKYWSAVLNGVHTP